ADVALDEADAPRQVLPFAGGEVVEADHRLAEPEQVLGEMRADEARRPGHEPGAALAPNALSRGFVALHVCSGLRRFQTTAPRIARPSSAPRNGPRRSGARSRPCARARPGRRARRGARLA